MPMWWYACAFTRGGRHVRRPLYDTSARPRTVSVTLNIDLVAKAQARGINISKVAETALAIAFEAAEPEAFLAEMHEAARFTDELVREFGRTFSASRRTFMPDDDTDETGHAA